MQKDLDELLAGLRRRPATTPDKAKEYLKTVQKERELQKKKASSTDLKQLDAQLEAIHKEIEQDFGIQSVEAEPLKRFDLITKELNQAFIHQEKYMDELVMAFKRPFVINDENKLKNCILVCGSPGSGRHSSLKKLAEEMAKQKLLPASETALIDMARYPTSNEEKLFLQDLYTALQSKGALIVFEHCEHAYAAYLKLLGELVSEGQAQLNKRYAISKDTLVEAGNTLVSQAVSSFSAKQKYLVFICEDPQKLKSLFPRSFSAAINDVCYTQPLDEQGIGLLIDRYCEQLKCKAAQSLKLTLIFEASFKQGMIKRYDIKRGVFSLIACFEQILKQLSSQVLQDPAFQGEVHLIEEQGFYALYHERRILLEAVSDDEAELRAVKEELAQIVGLKQVKAYILALEDHVRVRNLRLQKGLKSEPLSMHMIFTGNPGTGKTTIARLTARYLKAIHVLSGGQLVEVTRADLVGRYVGHTAPLTREIVQSALGGVLFIDEAYALIRSQEDSFGQEAIDTLVKEMEDHRDELVVILAGYTKEMNEFLQANSGLKSRFPNVLEFEDYSAEELCQIASSIAKGKGYVLEDDVHDYLLAYFTKMKQSNERDSGNGRLARNCVEAAILKQSGRVLHEENADLERLCRSDFEVCDE